MFVTARDFAHDGRHVGLRFALAAADRRHRERTVPIHGAGPITLRTGTSDMRTIRSIFGDGQYVPWGAAWHSIGHWYGDICSRAATPVIVDAGANIGASTRWFRLQFPDSAVIAIEPEPDNARLCRLNNPGPGVRVIEAAVGSRPGRVEMSTPGPRATDAFRTEVTEREGAVPMVTINELVADVPGELFIVKVDIEGFEA